MSREGLVSIIIPVFNSAEFIQECVESVLAQTYKRYELLLVDDGSQDNSRELCGQMCGKDERIRLICQDHRGVSAARNTGLGKAKGEYILFLDSDDAIHPLLIEECVCQIRCAGSDLALCNFRKIDTQRMKDLLKAVSEEDERPQWRVIGREESERWFHIVRPQALHCIGGSLFRRDMIGSVEFDESLLNGEDTLFIYHLICRRMRIIYSEKKWYYYREHSGNASHIAAHLGKDRYWESGRIIREAELARGNADYALPWECLFIYQLTKNFYGMKRLKNTQGCRDLKVRMAAERKHPLFPQIDRSTRVLFYCCFYCYPLYPLLEKLISVLWEAQNAEKRY